MYWKYSSSPILITFRIFLLLNMRNRIIIFCEDVEDGETYRRDYLMSDSLDVLITSSEKVVLNYLAANQGEVLALILLLDELEMSLANNFRRHSSLFGKNPDINFIEVAKSMDQLKFEVLFYHFPKSKHYPGEIELLFEILFSLRGGSLNGMKLLNY